MNIVFLLVPLALLFLIIGIVVFVWAVHDGQYDDLDTPASRILDDDD